MTSPFQAIQIIPKIIINNLYNSTVFEQCQWVGIRIGLRWDSDEINPLWNGLPGLIATV